MAASSLRGVGAALADLVLPRTCAGCGLPGATLCRGCAALLCRPRLAAPRRFPEGFPPTVAAGDYAGPVQPALNAFKERGRAELAGPLGAALALAVAAVVAGVPGPRRPVVLVPLPSSAAALRTRGRDPVRELAGIAVAELRSAGIAATQARLLRRRGRVRDSTGLSAAERRANLVGTFLPVPARAWPPPGALVVVVDDVVSSGATLTEAAAVLAVGRRAADPPVLAAAVAATPRQHDGRSSGHDPRGTPARSEVVGSGPVDQLSGPPPRD